MICPNCGRPLPPPGDACAHCGTRLAGTGDQVTSLAPAPLDLAPATDPDATMAAPGSVARLLDEDPDATVAGTPIAGLDDGERTQLATPTTPRRRADDQVRPASRPTAPRIAAAPLAPGMAFGARYRIIRELGVGGMGAVYQAWDEELSVAVALKLIRPEASGDPNAARELELRFKRELLLARQVTHKHVVRIHDLGELEGVKYITMPYVKGADLADILKDQGRLPVPRSLAIAKQVASGLQAAHDVGIVHRDLKPANIMIDGDNALIMDFGIARSIATAPPPASSSAGTDGISEDLLRAAGQTRTANPALTSMLTMVGGVVGTIQYMAPEQARAEAVDHRADIYAFGLIVYDMLLGARRQQSAESALGELKGRLQKAPPPLRSIDPTIPEPVEAVVSRCLHPAPSMRYQTTADLVAALDRLDEQGGLKPEPVVKRFTPRAIAGMVVLALGIVTGTFWLARQSMAPTVQPDPMSVLVADFENATGDPAFDGALEPGLTVGLERASFITAYPRPSAQRTLTQVKAGTRLDLAGARLVSAREGIKVIVAGRVMRDGTRYRLEAAAVNPADGATLTTADASASTREEVLPALESLATTLRRELGDTAPTSADNQRETFTAGSLDAARLYATAQDLAQNSKDEEAVTAYRDAIAADPSFGRAYAGWATSAYRLGRADEAAQLWDKAMSLMSRMSDRERYRTMGGYYLGIARNYEKAVENYTALIEHYPADGAGLNSLGVAYFGTLNFQKALEQGRKAVAIYPKNALYRNNVALYAMYAGDFAAGSAEARRVLGDNAAVHKAYLPIAIDALSNARYDDARTAYAQMAATGARGASLAAMGLADVAIDRGDYTAAERLLLDGIAGDAAAGNTSAQSAKWIALAELRMATGQHAAALEAVTSALALSRADAIVIPATDILLAAGKGPDVQVLRDAYGNQLQKQSRAYAKLIDAKVSLGKGHVADAVDSLTAAKGLADLWVVRFTLGRAYVNAGYAPEALSELDACLKRRGEATALFLDDVPTYRHVAPLYYWLARAQQGVNLDADAKANFETYLRMRGNVAGDPLAADARARLEAVS